MTIEEKALKTWGEASCPEAAIWITRDGTLVNGCMSGYIRDVDHAEIGQFFKTSKYHQPGSAWLYIKKFINRGNVRMCFSSCEAYFELSRTPTRTQLRTMCRCFAAARRKSLDVRIERMGRVPGAGKCYTREEYMAHLARYVPGLAA